LTIRTAAPPCPTLLLSESMIPFRAIRVISLTTATGVLT
jgi:hypothetical protein